MHEYKFQKHGRKYLFIVIRSFIHHGIVHPFVGIDYSNCQYQVGGFAGLLEYKFWYYLYKDFV